MRNIRVDSLPSDRLTAAQDCRLCTRRRIKCDRSIPSCQKCSSRSLSCPGYQLLLRWDQGVASRGKLTGRKVPFLSPDRPPIRVTTSSPGNSTSGFLSNAADAERDAAQLPHFESNAQLSDRYSSQALRQTLLRHFSGEVVPRLAWLDDPRNPWRRLVLPLAQQSTSLYLSILGLAAAHMWITSADDEAAPLAHQFRDASLRSLNAKLACELDRNPVTDPSPLVDITSTMVLLCYAEMLIPNSVNWKLHLRGCRASLDRYSSRIPQDSPQRPLSEFILEVVVYLEVFGTMSSFTANLGWDTTSSRPSCYDHFWGFTELLCTITMAERDRFRAHEQEHQLEPVDIGVWQAKAEQVYESTLVCVSSESTQNGAMQACLSAVTRAQYYACLIYTYQAIASRGEAEEAIPSLVDALFDEIMFITACPVPGAFQDISFPLFIAGTECRASKQRQRVIHNLFVKSVSTTGFSCNNGALQFLCNYWAAPNSQAVGRWIQHARANEQEMDPFILY